MKEKKKRKKKKRGRGGRGNTSAYLVERLFRGAVFCIDAFRFNSSFFPLRNPPIFRALARNVVETEYCKAVLFFGKKIPLERRNARTGRQRKLRPTVCLLARLPRTYIYIYI